MVWPIIKIITQTIGTVVGRTVIEAWKQVSTEAGNKEVFRRELRKAWDKQLGSRFEFHRLRKNLKADGASKPFGKPADAEPLHADADSVFAGKAMPAAESPLQDEARRKAMPAAEAVKVLHLSEASQTEIEKRYSVLIAANGDSGNSQYVHDKIVHARDVALDHLTRGTLKKHIKVKRDDPITEPPKSEL